MSLSRPSSLLALLLATLGLAALPAASVAQDDFVDEGIDLIEEEQILDEDMWCDDDVVAEDEEFFEDDSELRQVDEEFFDEEDPDFLGPDGEDDVFDDEPSDDELLDDCETVADDSGAVAEIGQILKPDVSKIAKKGVITAQIRVPGKAKVDSVLTKGSAKGKRLGSAHQKATKAGRFTIVIKLTKKGRKAVRNADGELPLTLTAKVKPAAGKKVTRVIHLTA